MEINIERLKLELGISVITVVELDVVCQIDEHAKARVNVIIPSEENSLEMALKLKGESITVSEIIENDIFKVIFKGYIREISVVKRGKYNYANINAISYSAKLDIEKKYGSFQKIGRTYQSIIREVVGRTKGSLLDWNIENCKVMDLLIQYEETDWVFLQRMVSHINAFIVVKEKNEVPSISIGIKKGSKFEWDDDIYIECKKGIDKKYYFSVDKKQSCRSDYIYYFFYSKNNYELGDWVIIEGNIFLVIYKKISLRKSEIIYSYKLVKEKSLKKEKKHNLKFKGLSLGGYVIKTDRENVYLKLDIDSFLCAEYPFKWEPIWGNLVYCMPECGERIEVKFYSVDEGQTGVSRAIRNNELQRRNAIEICNEFGDWQIRRFKTNKQKQVCLFPYEIAFESLKKGEKEELFEISDEKGIGVRTCNCIHIKACGEMFLRAKNLVISAPQEIRLHGLESSIQINRNFNIYSPKGIENCGLNNDKKKMITINSYEENKKWINNYYALAAMPIVNIEDNFGKLDIFTMAALPLTACGAATYSMYEILAGKEIEETSFPQVFDAMEVRTMNGGFPPPNLEK